MTTDEFLAIFHKANWDDELAYLNARYPVAHSFELSPLKQSSTDQLVTCHGEIRDRFSGSRWSTKIEVERSPTSPTEPYHPLYSRCTCTNQNYDCPHFVFLVREVLKRFPMPPVFYAEKFFAATEQAFKIATTSLTAKPVEESDAYKGHELALLIRTEERANQISQIIAAPQLRVPGWQRSNNRRGLTDSIFVAAVAHLGSDDGCDLGLLRCDMAQDAASHSGRAGVELRLRQHDAMLTRLLNDGRVFLDTEELPTMSLAAPVTPRVAWHIDQNGNQKIKLMRPNGTPCRPCQAFGLWDINPFTHTIAPLLCDPKQIAALAKSPVLSSANAKEARKNWPTNKGGILPKPADTSKVTDIQAGPRTKIKLRSLSTGPGEGETKLVADVIQDYDGTPISPDQFGDQNILLFPTKSGVQRFVRDRNAEAKAMQAVATAGLGSDGSLRDMAEFLNAVEALRGADFDIEDNLDESLVLDVGSEEQPFADFEDDGSSQWFNVSLGVDIGGQRHDLMPVIASALNNPRFDLRPAPNEHAHARWTLRMSDGTLVRIPLKQLRAWIEPIAEWLETDRGSSEKNERLRISRLQAAMLAEEITATRSDHLPELRSAIAKLLAVADAPTPTMPPTFLGTLFPYQNEGLKWLAALAAGGFGGILADDMGLGKTVQVLAHIAHQKSLGAMTKPVLIVMPTSLLAQWEGESKRFTPSLKVLRLHGPERANSFSSIGTNDVILTTYPLLVRDSVELNLYPYSLIVCDEAGAIKNHKSIAASVVRTLKADRHLLLSGTPLENHVGELWALMDLALPTLLGNEKHFKKAYRTKIEKHGDTDRLATLQRRTRPFILRRTKEEVHSDLPPKTVSIRYVEMEGKQAALYETIRATQHERVKALMAEKGLAKSGIEVIDALLKLRQVCCHPGLVKLKSARNVNESAKLDVLLELAQTIVDEGRQVLIFSQFAEMIELIGKALDAEKLPWQSLTGSTPSTQRAQLVGNFQAGNVPIFLVSLKAGGVGLNLTAADTVVLYDPWWNPAVEKQATDRAHRVGQDKPVIVYKLIVKGTVEEKIMALQDKKAALAEAVLDGGTSESALWTEAIIEELLAPGDFIANG